MRVLAVTSQTDPEVRPVELAMTMARGSSAEVIALCVVDMTPFGCGIGASVGPGAEAMLLPMPVLPPDPIQAVVDTVRTASTRVDRAVTIVTAEGAPMRVVAGALSELQPDLLVLPGAPPRGRLASWLIGDDWGPMIARSDIPVVLARGGGAGSGTVLVVLDDVRPSGDAVRVIPRLSLPRDTTVVLLGLLPAGGGDGRARHRQRMIRRLDAARSMLIGAGRRPSVLVQESSGVDMLLGMVDQVDAEIVVVASGHLGRRHRLTGIAEALARRSDRSVLVVPTSLQRRRRLVSRGGVPGRGTRTAGSTRTVT